MKTLYLIRHAKSSWGDFSTPDFDRPLNDRGKTDAPKMAKKLLEKKVNIDAFICSPAKRAKKTCRLICREIDFKEEDIQFDDSLYLAPAMVFRDVVSRINDRHNHVAIVAHNPGITDFANSLCKQVQIDEMPTCGIFAVKADISSWAEFNTAEKTFLFFDYPKSDREM